MNTSNIKFLYLTILILISCQSVEVKENERALLFKRFDSGLDTTKIFKPGKHRTASWNYFRVINISPKISKLAIKIDENTQFENIELGYKFRVIPYKLGQFEHYIGGTGQHIVEQEIVNHINNSNWNTYEKTETINRINQELKNKYLELLSIERIEN